ncbi:MAG: phosphoribosylamine--glycine ligase [Bacilli bacterium]|nr:phosphoribosylamine--glycine ligase [Bacilli bacterium]
MKILIVGNGGREHAIAHKLFNSPQHPELYVVKANPGMTYTKSVAIDESDIGGLANFALLNKIDLTIVGPEIPLSMGIVNEFKKHNLNIFGPTKEAAMIESSKKYAKELMKKYQIPTADYLVCSNYVEALKAISKFSFPLVLKFDGLAAGKGVSIVYDLIETTDFLKKVFVDKVFVEGDLIIEEFLDGPEFSLMAFVNGDKVYPMQIAQDHKRAFDGDLGPNTGGMGAYSPVPLIDDEDISYAVNMIMKPVAKALVAEERSFLGVLYGGLIKTSAGIKVIEFNARFGDPETEVVLPRLENDLVDVLLKVMNKKDIVLNWSKDIVLGVVVAVNGYPSKYDKGLKLNYIPEDVYHMGTIYSKNEIVTNGGRVLIALGRGQTFVEAKNKAYQNVRKIQGDNLFYRTDIGYQMINIENKKIVR